MQINFRLACLHDKTQRWVMMNGHQSGPQ